MSSRLDRLHSLRQRLDHEIAIETQRAACEPRPPVPPTQAQRLAAAGSSSADVRAWAQAQGLIPTGQTFGRLRADVVDAYLDAQEAHACS